MLRRPVHPSISKMSVSETLISLIYMIFMQSIEILKEAGKYTDEELDFVKRIREKSGLGYDCTYLPQSINPVWCGSNPSTGLGVALDECRMVCCGAVEDLLLKTRLDPKEIDIIITTCSIFCPTPSISSMIISHFKMRGDIQSYHLAGMGCSNGVCSVNLVSDLLQSYPKARVLFVTTETTTPAYYSGHERSRMVTNIIFRMGASAMLFTGSKGLSSFPNSKYQLQLHDRVNMAASDSAYHSIFYGPDEQGINGVFLSKEVVKEASKVLTEILWKIGPRVLPWQEQSKVAWSMMMKRLERFRALQRFFPSAAVSPYRTSFHGSVEHFVIHSGGAKILSGIGEGLGLDPSDLLPSRATLHDYGNVSSSSTWYALSWLESVKGIKKGDKVMQIGVGSGCKAGINVFQAMRSIDEVHEVWEHAAGERKVKQATNVGIAEWFKISLYVLLFVLVLQLLSVLLSLVVPMITE